MRTLLIGFSTEKTFRHTIEQMLRLGVGIDVLDLSRLLDTGLVVDIIERNGNLVISLGSDRYDFSTYSAVFNRTYWADLGSASRNATLSRLVRSILSWLIGWEGTVVNRPGSGTSNCNKFIHGLELKRLGFQIPETYLVGDPLRASILAHEGSELVSKSCSSTKTRTTAMAEAYWSDLERLLECPTIFQRRIFGDEVRVHWVGGILSAERIKTHRVDYRFADPNVPSNRYSLCQVPSEIAGLCTRYCESQSLMFAGFDFKVDRNESWIVLEANPMPGYESYDRRQNNKISSALADLLTSGRHTPVVQTSSIIQTSWDGHDSTMNDDYDRDIYFADEYNCVDMPLFIDENRRPVCRPFYYQTRLNLPANPL